MSNFTGKTKITFSDKYDPMIAYEIIDPTVYQNIGGGHMYMIGIERAAPRYPGLLLETPLTLPEGNTQEVMYYTASDSKDRFKGKIFYVLMLDSCEDIHEQSLTIFRTLFDSQIIIELVKNEKFRSCFVSLHHENYS
jgi:hypothetical protein